MQMKFAPPGQRRKQLDRAEKLLGIIKPDKEYPFEFICFRITGFRPRGPQGQETIKGNQLADDLGIFISQLSAQVAGGVDQQDQKVYSIEELADAFNVSTKTIHRWRKRALAARKFIFSDGKKRFGFLQSTVDEFTRANPGIAEKAKIFNRLTDKQKQLIIKQAYALAAGTQMSRYQIIEKISADCGRAHETIRYTILNYEKANPGKPIFKKPAGVVGPEKGSEIYRLFKQGYDTKELMERFNRSKSSIYRIINQRRAKEILAKKIEFIDSDEFLEADAAEKILAETISPKRLPSSGPAGPYKLGTGSLDSYLQALKDSSVLSRDKEVELFRRYNFLKYLACTTRAGIKPAQTSGARLRKIENYLAEAEMIKEIIIEANLRLVVSIASKHTADGANLQDLVSEGNFSLMRALEKFDYTRGFRFATYATWAIAKDYARNIPAETSRLDKARAGSMQNIHRDLRITEAADFAAIERARKSLVQVIKDELNEREQYIILNHFGLIGSLIKKEKKTLKQIGDHLNLTKERVRQIELIALQKLRHSLSIEEFELLTG